METAGLGAAGKRVLPMKRIYRLGIAVLALTLFTAAAGHAAPAFGGSAPPRASLFAAAWSWIASHLHPAPALPPGVLAKEGSDMDPNGHKLTGALLSAPPLDDAGSDMDPNGRQ